MRASTNDEGLDRADVSTRSADVRGHTIVVVEDDEDLRFVCSEALRSRGFIVSECGSVFDATITLKNEAPDILLLDRELPDGSGLDLARVLRGDPAYDGVRIVAFSARKAPLEIEEALRAGCDVFVEKPCGLVALVGRLEAVIATPKLRVQSPSMMDSFTESLSHGSNHGHLEHRYGVHKLGSEAL